MSGIRDAWIARAQHASDALVELKCKLRLETLMNEGYATIAQMGHDEKRRARYFPREIPLSRAEMLTVIGAGYRAVVFGLGDDLVIKTNYSFSHEVEREMSTHLRATSQIASTHPDSLRSLETVHGMISYDPNSYPIVRHKTGAFAPYFGREVFLIKQRVPGPDMKAIMDEYGPKWFNQDKIKALAELFWVFGDSGTRLQGDPADFCWDGDQWIAIDADGWMLYPTHDEYCLYTSKRSFLGVFTRDWSHETQLLKVVCRVAREVFGEMDNPSDPFAFGRILDKEDLLAPRHPHVRPLIQYEFDDPFRLDSILAHCNLCVAITRRDIFEDLLKKRDTQDIKSFYFGDIEVLEDGQWIVFHQPYNDANKTGDHAANHTGVSNKEIAHHVLNAARNLA